MKMHVEGSNNESPLGFGLRNVYFVWNSSNPDVLFVESLAITSTGDIFKETERVRMAIK